MSLQSLPYGARGVPSAPLLIGAEMIFKNAGEVTVTWTDSVSGGSVATDLLALGEVLSLWLLAPEERFVADLKRRGWDQSTGLARENPATASEDTEWHPWDKTREDIGWWWLWEEDHECW